MKKPEEFTDRIIALLREAGLTVFAEYAHPAAPLPPVPFLTAAPRKLLCGEPIPYADGIAMPVTLTLTLRLHDTVHPGNNTLPAVMEETVFPVLTAQGYDIRSMELSAPEYSKALNRTVCAAELVIGGLCLILPDY